MSRNFNALVIEDNPDDALVMERALRRAGHQVTFADSGAKGIRFGLNEAYDLVLLDYRLGDMAGTEVLLKIREKRPTVPVIVASGMGSHFIVARAIALGANGFVSKDDPDFATKLVETVDRIAETAPPAATHLPDRSTVASRAQEVRRMIGTLLEASDLIGSVGIVGPDGALINSPVQDKTGAQDVTAVLTGTVQMMLTTVAGHLGYGRSQFFMASFERGSIAMAPLPGNLVLFVTSAAGPGHLERLRKEIETAALELSSVMAPPPKAPSGKSK
jgi:CheY-like chemotaxis protein